MAFRPPSSYVASAFFALVEIRTGAVVPFNLWLFSAKNASKWRHHSLEIFEKCSTWRSSLLHFVDGPHLTSSSFRFGVRFAFHSPLVGISLADLSLAVHLSTLSWILQQGNQIQSIRQLSDESFRYSTLPMHTLPFSDARI